MQDLREKDLRHLWHPYTDHASYADGPFTCVTHAEGLYLHTSDGRKLLDGIASWWAVALGHSHPKLLEAIHRQTDRLQHCILGTLTHPMAIELAERLAAMCPGDLNRVYFAADGSSATEAAIKMAVQHHQYAGRPDRNKIVGLENGYHGDTLGAMAAGFTPWFREPFGQLIKPALQAPSPHLPKPATDAEQEAHADRAFRAAKDLVEAEADRIAAFIVEPLCQGAAGIHIYPPSYLTKIRALCDAHGILLIADEIAVGFGRTGTPWACDHAGIQPDILCIGKALTGGYLPMSAAIATDRVFEPFHGDGVEKRPFWDGHTYCGNPITAAVALAALDVYESEHVFQQAAAHAPKFAETFAQLAQHQAVHYHRTCGLIGMLSLEEQAGGAILAKQIADRALDNGLFIRPLGNTIYLWPPLVADEKVLGEMLRVLHQSIGG